MKSLERQLLFSLSIVLFVILLVLIFVANSSTKNLLETFVTSRLELDAKLLLDTLDVDAPTPKVKPGRINPVYFIPDSGHYYAIKISDKPDMVLSPSLHGVNLLTPLDSNLIHNIPSVTHDAAGPQGQRLIIWTKAYKQNGKGIVISIAEDMSMLMKNRQHFALLFLVIGIIGFILILLLQRYVVRRLFRHLDNSRLEIQQIESGERKQLSENVPTEIYPLVKEFNHSLSLMQQRMERSRNSLGNLAHALKTPLSLLMQNLEVGQEAGQELSQAKRQVERIRQLTERELKRARLAGLGNTTERFDSREELPILINVLKQAYKNKALKVELVIEDSVKIFGDREDMLELLGNLLDNAFKWAKSEVSCLVRIENNKLRFILDDDGEGKAPNELEQLAQRGVRLDESIEGHGLGLAICKDIVKLYAGTIEFSESKTLGGFQVTVDLPLLKNENTK